MSEFNDLLESIRRLNATEEEKREVQRIVALQRIHELREKYCKQQKEFKEK